MPSKLNLQFYFPNFVHKSSKSILEKYCQVLDHNMVTLHQVTMRESFTSGEHVGIQHGHLRSRSHGHFRSHGNPTCTLYMSESNMNRLKMAIIDIGYAATLSARPKLPYRPAMSPNTHMQSQWPINFSAVQSGPKVVKMASQTASRRVWKKISPGGTLAWRGHPSQTHPWTRWRSGIFPAPQGGTRATVRVVTLFLTINLSSRGR